MSNPLFDLGDITPKDNLEAQSLVSTGASSSVHISTRAGKFLKELQGEIVANRHIDFCTAGELSIHHLIDFCLKICGPSAVYISTWAIKEAPARALLSLKQSGLITELYAVFDERVKKQDAKHFQLIEPLLDSYALTKNHAKVVVIIGKEMNLCIVGSANLSNNPRIESGFISTCPPSVNFHFTWMNKVLQGKKVY